MRSFCSDRKKVRGQRRKLRKLLRDIDGLTPFESESNRLYEHFHVPSGTWLNSPRDNYNTINKPVFMRFYACLQAFSFPYI